MEAQALAHEAYKTFCLSVQNGQWHLRKRGRSVSAVCVAYRPARILLAGKKTRTGVLGQEAEGSSRY